MDGQQQHEWQWQRSIRYTHGDSALSPVKLNGVELDSVELYQLNRVALIKKAWASRRVIEKVETARKAVAENEAAGGKKSA